MSEVPLLIAYIVCLMVHTYRLNDSGAMSMSGRSAFQAGGGAMGAKLRAFDWSSTPLGPIDTWSPVLQATVDTALTSGFPVALFLGPDLICIHNDGYTPMLGNKAGALGVPLRETWAEVWDDLRPIAEKALAGESTFIEDHPLDTERFDRIERGYFTFSYSPIFDAGGAIIGMVNTVVETTSSVLAREASKAESERQTALFQQMPGFVGVVEGPDLVYTYANDAYRALAGKRDFVGRSVRQVFPEVEDQGFFDILDRVYQTGERFTSRGSPVRFEGEDRDRFVDLLFEPIRDGGGTITGLFIGGYDVTEQKRAEQKAEALVRLSDLIREAETIADLSYATGLVVGETLKVSRVGYGTVDLHTDDLTVERDWNAEGVQSIAGVLNLRDFGSFVDDIKAGNFIAISDVREDPRTMPAAQALEERHARSFVNFPIVERERAVAVLYINYAEVRHWSQEDLAFFREVAERTRTAIERLRATESLRRREAELRDLNEQLENRVSEALAERKVFSDVIDGSTAAVTALDLDFRILAINRANVDAFEAVFGKRPRVGDAFLDLFVDMPAHLSKQQDIWQRALRGEDFSIIEPFGDDQYQRRYFEVRFSTLRDGQGRKIGASSTSYDVTDKVRAEQQLEAAQEQLRQAQKMEAVGQLTGGIAHDFNNMLAVVSGSLDLLDRRTAVEDNRAKRLITAAQEAARRAASLTKRLLAFSRQQPLDPEVLEINKLVSGMSDLFRHSLGADVRLETVLAGGVWPVYIDQNQLESILLNLAVNARDAMPGGGHLTIETQNAHLDGRYVSKEPGVTPGQYVMVAVTDTGFGMTPEVIAKAFDPFFTTKGVGKGTGLGLSQVYGFIKQSGGHIKIYSELAQGTTIKLYLPRHMGQVTLVDGDSDDQAVPVAESRELVLVVDDEEIVRNFSIEALEELGYAVLSAPDAMAAMTIISERADIDLLFTDVVMPDINGSKLVEMMRPVRPRLPVLYTTGYTRNAIVHNGVLDAGVDLIGKPFTIDELGVKVREVLDTAILKAKQRY